MGEMQMKVLLINGSPHEKGCTYTALKEAADALTKQGVGADFLWIGNEPMSGCIAAAIVAGRESVYLMIKSMYFWTLQMIMMGLSLAPLFTMDQ